MQNTDTPRDWLPPLPCAAGSKFIRVLKIAKPTDPSDEEIVCSIETIDIASDTSFTALSYVWGVTPSLTKTIRCNGKAVAVGTNCWSALWHLRNGHYSNDSSVSGGSRDTLTIWVDSICIDQQDLKEKESQLRLMADIYSLARQVFVWLGEGSPESDAAMEYLNKAGYQEALVELGDYQYKIPRNSLLILKQGWNMFICRMKSLRLPLWKYCVELMPPCLPSQLFCNPTDLQDICSRTWASRIWTFQEILLSPHPLLCCGTKTLPWRSFIHGITFLAVAPHYTLSPIEHRWCSIVQLWVYVRDCCALGASTGNQQLPFKTYLWDYERFIEGTFWACGVIEFMAACLAVWTIIFSLLFSREGNAPELLKSEVWIVEFVLNIALCVALSFAPMLGIFILIYFFSFIRRLVSDKGGPPVDRANRILFNTTLTDARDAIIYEIATRKATNPKDKSFGLRAVLGKIGIQLDDPDYNKDIYQIYRELFVRLLEWSGSLSLLLFCDSSTISTLPSWMPNLAIDPDKSWLNPKALAFQGEFKGVFFRTPSQWSLTNNNELVVRGVHVCCVSWSCGRFYETSIADYASDEQSHLHNISMIHDLMRRYREWTPTTTARRHHALLHWERRKLGGKDKQRLKEWGQMMRRTSIMPDASMSAFSYLKSHPACFEFHINMCNDLARRGRTLFLTQPGILGIGNGPANIQVTDLVTLVAGVSKPLILETGDTRHRLKGFAEMEYESELSALACITSGNIYLDPYWSGWEDLGAPMQPQDEIVLY